MELESVVDLCMRLSRGRRPGNVVLQMDFASPELRRNFEVSISHSRKYTQGGFENLYFQYHTRGVWEERNRQQRRLEGESGAHWIIDWAPVPPEHWWPAVRVKGLIGPPQGATPNWYSVGNRTLGMDCDVWRDGVSPFRSR